MKKLFILFCYILYACEPLPPSGGGSTLPTQGTACLSIPQIDLSHPDNFYFKKLPTTLSLHPDSDSMIAELIRQTQVGRFRMVAREYSIPVYYANNSTPRKEVIFNAQSAFVGYKMIDVPFPVGAKEAPGGDKQLAIIDTSSGLIYEFGYFQNINGTLFTAAGTATAIKNSGLHAPALRQETGGTRVRGSAFNFLGGVIWPHQLFAGKIEHALFASYKFTSTKIVHPAKVSDGTSNHPYALPMGTLLQLDPDLDLNSLNLTPEEKVIARALQEYGMYIGDTNGAGLAVEGIAIQSFSCNPYKNINATYGAFYMPNIPLNRLRVVEFPFEEVPETPHLAKIRPL